MGISLLVFFVFLSIGVSFICSMLEAVILSVTPSYLASLEESEPKLYKRVMHLKDDIERPLASILTFNTVAHTIGAAGAGAEAQRLFGSEILAVFSVILTFGILFFSEIIPKSIGASSWKLLLPLAARILPPMIILSLPLVWMSEIVSKFFKGNKDAISRAEIAAMADIGLNDGTLESTEHRALKSLVSFEAIRAAEILTPAEKVKSLPIDATVEEAYKQIQFHPFSRIIVFDEEEKSAEGFILRTKLQAAHIEGSNKTVRDLLIPLLTLPETVSLPKLFQILIQRREHICAIQDDHSNFLGVISLEDLIEHMLDLEIYDEQDQVVTE